MIFFSKFELELELEIYLFFKYQKKAEMTTQTLEQTREQIKQLETKLEEHQVVSVLFLLILIGI